MSPSNTSRLQGLVWCMLIDSNNALYEERSKHLVHHRVSLSRGGLGLRRLELHSSAAYLASVIKTSNSDPPDEFSRQAVSIYNSLVPQASSLSDNSLLESGSSQKSDLLELKTISLISCVRPQLQPTVPACCQRHLAMLPLGLR